ncbi:MAG TPA: hypothetical protein VGM41_02810 [Chitinophagaceae bacterium]|jgi:hypothetical protein
MRIKPYLSLAVLCLFLSPALYSQSVYTLKADTVLITNCDSAELILQNHTQGVNGFLYNKGTGHTEFRHGLVSLNDTVYVIGSDTLHLNKILKYSGTGGSAHQEYMIYTRDYSNGSSLTYTMAGWNAQYTGTQGQFPLLVVNMGILMYIPAGTPVGSVLKATLQGSIVYTMTVSASPTADAYAIGLVRVDQDIKYLNQYYIRGAAETINAAGIISTTGLNLRLASASFVNPSLVLSATGTSTVRIGCNYKVDVMQPGDWQF